MKTQKKKKKFKNQKPRIKCVKCMKKERKRDHTKGKKQGSDQNPSGEDRWVEGKVFGREKRRFLLREIKEK